MATTDALTAYLAPQGRLTELLAELGSDRVLEVHDHLVLARGAPVRVAWVRNIWHDPVRISFASINDAARALRDLQRNWVGYSTAHHRRAALIQSKLPHVSAKPLVFPAPPPSAPLGSWTLLGRDTLLASTRCSSAFPNGEVRFVEDRRGPPNRAYLKLWEALTLLGQRPSAGQHCVDLGAAPGGWTWVLQSLGARVTAIDKAALDADVAALPGVEQQRQSAFAVPPDSLGTVDWLVADIACYPERLLRLVHRWREAGTCDRFVCTLKFQGATDHEVTRRFAAIPRSALHHLSHNKHELTWTLLPEEERAGA